MGITKLELHSRINKFALLTFAFLIPFHDHLTSYPFIILLLNWLAEGRFKEKFVNLSQNRHFLLFISFYILYLIGLCYSSNINYALNDLRIKLPLLLLPVFLFSINYNRDLINKILRTFVFSCFLAVLACLISASYYFFSEGLNHFSYMELSIFKHPGYFALYLNLCVALLSSDLILNSNYLNIPKWSNISLMLLFAIFILLLSAKMGIVILSIVLGIILIVLFVKRKYILGLSVISLILITGFLSVNYFPAGINRFYAMVDNAKAIYYKSRPVETREATFLRIGILKISLDLIKKNPIMGVGTGDVKDVLIDRYANTHGMKMAYYHKLNSHNQYLQTTITLGIIGLSILLAMLLYPMYAALKQKYYIYFMFLLVMSLYLLTDSLLEVQAGVMFYGFFNAILFFSKKND